MQFAAQWSWKEMVLKEVVYKIVDNFGNNGWIWLKFWHNMDAYKGHLWCELLWELLQIVCVFNTLPDLLIRVHNGYNRHD